jgi:tRNA C32,U32 (ribose-2'-O)-methylase TrmJ
MGLEGSFKIVGSPAIVNQDARRLAKHASPILDRIRFFASLPEALADDRHPQTLSLASTARIGSAHRPHPLWVRPAMQRAFQKLRDNEISQLRLVFGPESDGLSNEEVEACDWVVTIPSSETYRSLNLAQAILIFSYEANMNLVEDWEPFRSEKPSQRERLVSHFIRLAEEVGFVLPGDPFKMRPRLEEILSQLPRHIKDVKTLHGLLDQAIRSAKKGQIDLKGRFKKYGKQDELRE